MSRRRTGSTHVFAMTRLRVLAGSGGARRTSSMSARTSTRGFALITIPSLWADTALRGSASTSKSTLALTLLRRCYLIGFPGSLSSVSWHPHDCCQLGSLNSLFSRPRIGGLVGCFYREVMNRNPRSHSQLPLSTRSAGGVIERTFQLAFTSARMG